MKDISRRVVNILTGQNDAAALDDQPAILVADDLTPNETVQLNKSKLLGFITRHGSSNSHTAILARTMNIPALIGVDFDDGWDGKLAVLDGYNHCVYIEPAAELLATMEEKRKGDLKQEALLQGLKKKPNVTLDGKEIKVYANIGNAGDVGLVLQNDALGYRAIRICLTRKEIFKTQLRAILRASAFGTVSIMFPMVISVRETSRHSPHAETARGLRLYHQPPPVLPAETAGRTAFCAPGGRTNQGLEAKTSSPFVS